MLDAGFADLDKDLAALDESFRKCGQTLAGKPLLASHPVYQYFARAYGLDLTSVHWEPDAQPVEDDDRLLALGSEAFWQGLQNREASFPMKGGSMGSASSKRQSMIEEPRSVMQGRRQ